MELGGYEIVGKIAVGGMAEIYRARATPAAQKLADEPDEVVVKRLLPALRAEQKAIDLFVGEGKLTTKLRHPNIVRTFKLFKKGSDYLMVLEFVDGITFEQLMVDARHTPRWLDTGAVLHIITDTLKALDYVHRVKLPGASASIVHRDVNPANILIDQQGEVKLTDFGVADAEGLTAAGEQGLLRGTIPYMSPEQVVGKSIDRRADLYAVGIMMWESFAGRRLYEGESDLDTMRKVREGGAPLLARMRPDLPELLHQIVRKALFVDPRMRFQTAQEFLNALQALGTRARLVPLQPGLAEEVQRVIHHPSV
ncbi:MAG: serine/threonine protein kinase [Deltaproteobacteria bacterium]|nr:serine/threonine protein kinase [Deltaproteobacteria bacterium]